ncbi:MAG: hypothetical protein AAB413_02030 [Patescibacteria group bacterium]|mgnify:CR=1 FL=1
MSQPLFDKTYDELREAFVRARFAEPAVFGRPDIEEWLRDSTRHVVDPLNPTSEWGAGAFHWHLKEILGGRGDREIVDLLLLHTTPQIDPPETLLVGIPHAGEFYTLLRTLQLGHAMLFCGRSLHTDSWPILVINNKAYVAEFKEPNHILALRPAISTDVKRIFFAEVMYNRPKRERALDWLTTEYQHVIANTRYAAQRDFDEAVAVSADGTKIVKAKWVMVYGRTPEWGQRVYLLPGEAFRVTKCLITSIFRERIDDRFLAQWLAPRIDTLDDFFAWEAMMTPVHMNRKLRLTTMTAKRTYKEDLGSLLTIDEVCCPSPLPDGGREIKV